MTDDIGTVLSGIHHSAQSRSVANTTRSRGCLTTGGGGLLLSRGGEGGRGFWTQNLVYQKWPDQIFPIVNFVFSRDVTLVWGGGEGVLGEGSPPLGF